MELVMKNQVEILQLIRTKISENQIEVEGCLQDLELLRKDKQSYGSLDTAMKHAILKDKAMFHKAVIACLDDLKQEIEK